MDHTSHVEHLSITSSPQMCRNFDKKRKTLFQDRSKETAETSIEEKDKVSN